jgi:putative transcriptional regulator
MKNIVRKLRVERDLSQDDLAKSLGISRPNLSNIERGIQIPKASLIFKIASFFGKPAEQIFFEDDGLQAYQNQHD